MKKAKILIVAFAVILVAAITGVTYAYWDALSSSDDIEINVGEQTVLTLTLDSNTAGGKTLIPAGAMKGPSDVYSVDFTYNVVLSKTPANPAVLHVSVKEGSIKINNDDTYAGLVLITIDNPGSISDEAEFTVTIALDEPEDETAYAAVAGKAITFEIEVSASVD
jgi:hypothetical protein